MSKHLGATSAFQKIVQKMDETFNEAHDYLRSARDEEMKSKNKVDLTLVSSPAQSERSCSPPLMQCISSSDTAPLSQKVKKEGSSSVKNKAYRTFDKKQFVIKTSIKSKHPITESDVKKVQKLIKDIIDKNTASCYSSSSSSSISSTMII